MSSEKLYYKKYLKYKQKYTNLQSYQKGGSIKNFFNIRSKQTVQDSRETKTGKAEILTEQSKDDLDRITEIDKYINYITTEIKNPNYHIISDPSTFKITDDKKYKKYFLLTSNIKQILLTFENEIIPRLIMTKFVEDVKDVEDVQNFYRFENKTELNLYKNLIFNLYIWLLTLQINIYTEIERFGNTNCYLPYLSEIFYDLNNITLPEMTNTIKEKLFNS